MVLRGQQGWSLGAQSTAYDEGSVATIALRSASDLALERRAHIDALITTSYMGKPPLSVAGPDHDIRASGQEPIDFDLHALAEAAGGIGAPLLRVSERQD
eukprot:scaffold182030_cov28-Tisochrysis_lutea.AAC.2